jgi:hypothetical protein
MTPHLLPYDPRWVAKLLRRDVRNLKVKKIKARLPRSSCKAPFGVQEQADFVIVELESPRVNESTMLRAHSEVSTFSSPYL